jgi:hypothetical protein
MMGNKSRPKNRNSLLSIGEYSSANEIESFRFGKHTVNALESSRSNLTKYDKNSPANSPHM